MGKKGPLWWRESDWLLRGSSAANQILFRHSGPILSIRYHRNVDVYAAGLTFTAMLQSQPNQSLIPKAEGPVESTELAMPVGLIAYNRMVYGQPDITVVEDRASDSTVEKRVKEVIREMTHISSSRRLAALHVIEKVS